MRYSVSLSHISSPFFAITYTIIIYFITKTGEKTRDWEKAREQLFLYYDENIGYIYLLSIDHILDQVHSGELSLRKENADLPKENSRLLETTYPQGNLREYRNIMNLILETAIDMLPNFSLGLLFYKVYSLFVSIFGQRDSGELDFLVVLEHVLQLWTNWKIPIDPSSILNIIQSIQAIYNDKLQRKKVTYQIPIYYSI